MILPLKIWTSTWKHSPWRPLSFKNWLHPAQCTPHRLLPLRTWLKPKGSVLNNMYYGFISTARVEWFGRTLSCWLQRREDSSLTPNQSSIVNNTLGVPLHNSTNQILDFNFKAWYIKTFTNQILARYCWAHPHLVVKNQHGLKPIGTLLDYFNHLITGCPWPSTLL